MGVWAPVSERVFGKDKRTFWEKGCGSHCIPRFCLRALSANMPIKDGLTGDKYLEKLAAFYRGRATGGDPRRIARQ